MSLNGFEEADQQALIPTVPQSSNESKVVRLGAKVLETKKEMRKVLTEEIYVDNMQKIIVRDYFPELPKLKAQAEYLDAVARNDQAKIRELQVRYSTKRTDRRTSPSARPKTPKAFDATTPGPSGSGGTDLPFSNIEGDNASVDAKKKKKKVIDNLSLQKYMDSYTSEDNASFEELAEIHQRRELIKNAWMYNAEEKHNKQLVYRTTRAVLPADEHAIAIRDRERERPNDIDNWEYKARNPVLFHPEDAPLTVEEHIQIMKQNEKIINKEATRLNEKTIQQPHQSSMARAAMHHAVVNSGLVDISGKDLGIVSASTLGCVATPTPMPGVAESPLMTWGEIEGTPFRLDGADIASTVSDDAPAFKIPEVPLRERIAQEISDTIAKRYRDKRKFAMEHVEKMHAKTPKFGSVRSTDKLAIMSPAARRLANNKLGIRIGTDKFLKSTYSPRKTPGSTRSTIYSPAIHKYVKVKKEVKEELRSNPPSAPSTPREYVTDDLLHLPSPTAPPVVDPSARPSASDFF